MITCKNISIGSNRSQNNEQNKSTGGQNTYQNHVEYKNIAKASGFDLVENVVTSLEEFSSILNTNKTKAGLNFIHVKCGIDDETPRPPIEVVKVNKLKSKQNG